MIPRLFALLALASILCGSAAAQPARQGRAGGAPSAEGEVSPGEVQRMFDAYALMQAQEQLKIGDEQFAQFLTRYKALQDVRRKNVRERARLVMELRRMLNASEADEGRLKEQMKALQEHETGAAAEIKKAHEAVDQVLDVRQQARFRVFEEVMERRKLELVTRARQANRLRNQQ